MSEPVSISDYKRQLAELQEAVAATKQHIGMDRGGGGPHFPDMSERMGRFEGIVEGLKHGQAQLLVAVGILAAFVVGFGIYTLQRIDQVGDRLERVSDRVADLPNKISTDLRDIAKTLAEIITATKVQAPGPTPPASQPSRPTAPQSPR